MVQTTLIPAISLVTNEHTFNGIVDKTFNIWRDGFVYILSFEKKTLSDRVMQNLIFEKKKSKCVNMADITALWKKNESWFGPKFNFLSKCVNFKSALWQCTGDLNLPVHTENS